MSLVLSKKDAACKSDLTRKKVLPTPQNNARESASEGATRSTAVSLKLIQLNCSIFLVELLHLVKEQPKDDPSDLEC